jgi:hypothetical protein
MTTIVVSAYSVATKPQIGGHFWVYFQYVHGLRQLGCEVFWLEQLPRDADPNQLDVFFRCMERYGLGGKVILYRTPRPGREGDYEFLGVSKTEAERVIRRADLLLNFHYAIDPDMLGRFQRTALVDIDPGLLQFWIAGGQLSVPPHNFYLTIGETVGGDDTRIPDCQLPWIHIRPVVCLDLWPYAYDPTCRRFTTVSSWLAGEYVTERTSAGKKILYENDKRVSFLRFVELPTKTTSQLELAGYFDGVLDADDQKLLQRNGWHIRHSLDVGNTPERYQSYIQTSRGEFSCVKPSCIAFENAWVSDRTLCYLASGKPAVVQHTGPSSFLPTGEGLFRFSTIDEAVDALATVDADYERHCRAARRIAEDFFDAAKLLPQVVDCVA